MLGFYINKLEPERTVMDRVVRGCAFFFVACSILYPPLAKGTKGDLIISTAQS